MSNNTELVKEDKSFEEMVAEADAERKKALYRHKMPAKRDLVSMLNAMTKAELDDIRANLNVTGTSSLKKAELADRLAKEIPQFLTRWVPSMLEEQAGVFERIIAEGGITQEFGDGDARFDYLRGLGFISCGVKDGQLYWYMPTEICDGIDAVLSQKPQQRLHLNSEAARLATGVLFYYGYLNFEELYDYVAGYQRKASEEPLTFGDFVAVLLNASCWQDTLEVLPQGAKYYTLMDENKIEDERLKRADLQDALFTYAEIYAAGKEAYVEATPAFNNLTVYLMRHYQLRAPEAVDLVAQALILMQNGSAIQEVLEYFAEEEKIKADEMPPEFLSLLTEFNNTTHMWMLKGHTPNDLMQEDKKQTAELTGKIIPFNQVRRHKVGRNDPCPCGSGKKYKNCCMRKDEN